MIEKYSLKQNCDDRKKYFFKQIAPFFIFFSSSSVLPSLDISIEFITTWEVLVPYQIREFPILLWHNLKYNAFADYALQSVAYSKPCQSSKIERFVKIVNGFKPLTIFARCSVLDVWQSSEYTIGNYMWLRDHWCV